MCTKDRIESVKNHIRCFSFCAMIVVCKRMKACAIALGVCLCSSVRDMRMRVGDISMSFIHYSSYNGTFLQKDTVLCQDILVRLVEMIVVVFPMLLAICDSWCHSEAIHPIDMSQDPFHTC